MARRLEAMSMELGLARHVAGECCEQNCKLAVPNVDGRLTIKADGAVVDKKACDCVVFYYTNTLNIVIVELKSSGIRHSSIREKFDNTLEWALERARTLIPRTQPRVRLTLLAKTFKHGSSYETIKKYKWPIGGRAHALQMHRCGYKLPR